MNIIQKATIFGFLGILVCCYGTFVSADENETGNPIPLPHRFLPNPLYVKDSVLVQAAKETDGSVCSLSAIHAAIGASVQRDYSSAGIRGLSLVKIPDTMSVPDAIAYYSSIPSVSYAEPDYYVTAMKNPEDPEFWRQWGLSNTGSPFKEDTPPGIAGADIRARSGWDIATGTNNTIIAVIDSGADIYHPDLAGNIWSQEQSGTVLHGINVMEDIPVEPWDDYGHGTHCAGIIGMIGSNDIGGTGVAWNVTIIPIKALDYRGWGTLSDLALGMAYASLYHADVISCSFGTTYNRIIEDIIRQSPALFVCAAGNYGCDLETFPIYPASYQFGNVIAVAATDARDELSSFSNYGPNTVHVAAPGTDIYSTGLSSYSYSPLFFDPAFSTTNFTLTGNWTLVPGTEPGELPSLHGVIPAYDDNQTCTIELNRYVFIPDDTGDVPHLVWDIKGNFDGYLVIELSYDGEYWSPVWECDYEVHEDDYKQVFIPLNQAYPDSEIVVRYEYSVFNDEYTTDFSIRNIRIGYRGEVIQPRFVYMNGTSMAAPMISGMAGLIKGINPDLSAAEIKQVIMDTADPLPSLQKKIITGARVNLSAALNSLKKRDAIWIKPGWNCVSVPGELAKGYDTAAIFAGVNATGHSILAYGNDSSGYQALSVSDAIVPLHGYWIYSTDLTNVPVRFSDMSTGVSRQMPAGWSLTGGWTKRDVSAKQTFFSLNDMWLYAIGYNTSCQQYEEPIINDDSENYENMGLIRPYCGYWMYCIKNGTYQSGI